MPIPATSASFQDHLISSFWQVSVAADRVFCQQVHWRYWPLQVLAFWLAALLRLGVGCRPSVELGQILVWIFFDRVLAPFAAQVHVTPLDRHLKRHAHRAKCAATD